MSVFPLWWISLTAGLAGVVSVVMLHWRFRELAWKEVLLLGLVVALSVFSWRSAGNVPELNADPVPPFSPNDLLCPTMTFVFLSVYAAVHQPLEIRRWNMVRALLTLISLVVNVVVI